MGTQEPKPKTYTTVRMDSADAERLRKVARDNGMTLTGVFRAFTSRVIKEIGIKPRRAKADAA